MSTMPDLNEPTLSSLPFICPSGNRDTREPCFSSSDIALRELMLKFSRSTGMQRKDLNHHLARLSKNSLPHTKWWRLYHMAHIRYMGSKNP